jgi:hypothetical protein
MDDEDGRQIALALSNRRRSRGRYFHELSAEAERREAGNATSFPFANRDRSWHARGHETYRPIARSRAEKIDHDAAQQKGSTK